MQIYDYIGFMILFVAGDAGPAEYLARIINGCSERFACVSSPITRPIFEKHGVINSLQFDSWSDIRLVFTGTCWNDEGIDKKFMLEAIEKKIPCVSVVEHWSWYKKRFTIFDKISFPNHIIVNDTVALNEAIKEGLPKEKLVAFGNPVLEDLANKLPASFPPNALLDFLGLKPGTQVAVFISEEYRKDYAKGTTFYSGFDEFDALHDIISVIPKNTHLVIKLHPAEDPKKYSGFKRHENVSIIGKTNLELLINKSDFFLGLGSMLLIEAAFTRSDVLSYRPNELIKFIGNEMGVTHLINNKNELKDIFSGKIRPKNKNIKDVFTGSKERILSFIKRILK